MGVLNIHRPIVVRRSPAFSSLECRFGAYLIDTILFLFVQTLFLYLVVGYPYATQHVTGFLGTQLHIFFSDWDYLGRIFKTNLYFMVLHWLYYATMESSSLQGTIGKIALGMKVSSIGGHRITFAQASVRYFGKYLSVGILFAGFFVAFFNARHQTLHDIIASAIVKNRTIKKG
jgi:uncharacterized RDD family membrane protein YckC